MIWRSWAGETAWSFRQSDYIESLRVNTLPAKQLQRFKLIKRYLPRTLSQDVGDDKMAEGEHAATAADLESGLEQAEGGGGGGGGFGTESRAGPGTEISPRVTEEHEGSVPARELNHSMSTNIN